MLCRRQSLEKLLVITLTSGAAIQAPKGCMWPSGLRLGNRTIYYTKCQEKHINYGQQNCIYCQLQKSRKRLHTSILLMSFFLCKTYTLIYLFIFLVLGWGNFTIYGCTGRVCGCNTIIAYIWGKGESATPGNCITELLSLLFSLYIQYNLSVPCTCPIPFMLSFYYKFNVLQRQDCQLKGSALKSRGSVNRPKRNCAKKCTCRQNRIDT